MDTGIALQALEGHAQTMQTFNQFSQLAGTVEELSAGVSRLAGEAQAVDTLKRDNALLSEQAKQWPARFEAIFRSVLVILAAFLASKILPRAIGAVIVVCAIAYVAITSKGFFN